jgi:hypothetical protein
VAHSAGKVIVAQVQLRVEDKDVRVLAEDRNGAGAFERNRRLVDSIETPGRSCRRQGACDLVNLDFGTHGLEKATLLSDSVPAKPSRRVLNSRVTLKSPGMFAFALESAPPLSRSMGT